MFTKLLYQFLYGIARKTCKFDNIYIRRNSDDLKEVSHNQYNEVEEENQEEGDYERQKLFVVRESMRLASGIINISIAHRA